MVFAFSKDGGERSVLFLKKRMKGRGPTIGGWAHARFGLWLVVFCLVK